MVTYNMSDMFLHKLSNNMHWR